MSNRDIATIDNQTDALRSTLPEPRLVGYARVSTDDQDLSLQIDALTKQGIPPSSIFMDKISGAKTERPGLTKCLETLRHPRRLAVGSPGPLDAASDHAGRGSEKPWDRIPFDQ